MKKERWITLGVIIFIGAIVYLLTRQFFLTFSQNHPTTAGFIKFFILATIGDVIGNRLKDSTWAIPKNILPKAIVWGIIGMVISMIFVVFSSGVQALMANNILPFSGNVFFTAFFTSVFMNVIFAPTMMGFHRITDAYLNHDKANRSNALKEIDWHQFIRITVFRVIPLFWIPAHTITFLLPSHLRVLFAAILGIVLGILLNIFQKQKVSVTE